MKSWKISTNQLFRKYVIRAYSLQTSHRFIQASSIMSAAFCFFNSFFILCHFRMHANIMITQLKVEDRYDMGYEEKGQEEKRGEDLNEKQDDEDDRY